VEPCSRRLANGAVRMFILLGAGRERVAGLEAVPTGYGLEISATTGHGDRVEALVVPEAGSFRIELLGERSPAEMLITVRTPETQLGYRSQTILEGEPHPLEMGFLESPLTYSGPYDLDDLAWEGDTCTATLEEDAPGANPGSYAARVDGETGIVVWERQEWDDYRGTIEITRRLVPLPSVKTPSPQDVIDYARADWEESLDVAQNSPFPVYGLDLPGLLLHTLQVGEEDEVTWLRYATETSPGRIAAELLEDPSGGAPTWPEEGEEWHDTWSDDHQVPASGRTLIRGDRSIYIRIYTWALEELGITEPDVEEALMELDRTPAGTPTGKAEPPHLVFDDLMPLPQGADFAETLPLELTR
jgi:hypothetical protein